MDLLLVGRMVWRYRWAALAVLLLTGIGAAGVVAVRQPEYEAAASFVLINPPAPPGEAELRADPSLATARTDNPFARFDNPWVIVDVLAQAVTTDAARADLVRAGADRRYRVAPSSKFGFVSPIIQVTGVGPTAAGAIRTAGLVSKALTAELHRMQHAQGIDDRYLITPLPLDLPRTATRRSSGTLRSLIGVIGLGGILLVVVPAALDAVRRWRLELTARAAAAAPGRPEPDPADPDPAEADPGESGPGRTRPGEPGPADSPRETARCPN